MSRSGLALTADWNKSRRALNGLRQLPEDVNRAVREEAERIAQAVKMNMPFEQGTDNAETTVKRKGSNAPLFESGGLEGSIGVSEYSDAGAHATTSNKRYYVIKGSKDKVSTPDGRDHGITYEKLLEIMEYGCDHSGYLGMVSIPERPILSVTWDMEKGRVQSNIVGKYTRDFKRRMEGM